MVCDLRRGMRAVLMGFYYQIMTDFVTLQILKQELRKFKKFLWQTEPVLLENIAGLGRF